MKQRISFEAGSPGLLRGFYIRDYDFPHPIGPFETIAKAHDWLMAEKEEREGYGAFRQRITWRPSTG